MAPKSKENPKKRASKDSSEQREKKQKNVKKEAVKQQKEQLVSKCRPGQLVDIMKDLNVAQMAAIRETGFGGILHLNVRTIPTTIIEWILDAFNPSSHLFVAKKLEFLLTKEDIHDIFGVPRVGEPVEKKPTNHVDEEEFEAVRSKWRNMFQVTDKKEPVRLQHLYSRLKSCKESGESGEEFKRLFVVVSMSCFLAPTSNYTLDMKILRAVENVDAIKNHDWSSYIFQKLIHSLEKFKTNKTKGLSGCIMALIIAYFHRIAFKGIESPHSIPLLQYWDAETFKERVAEELKCGSLGCGPVTKISYPICVNYEAEAVQYPQQQKQQPPPEPQKQPPQKQQQQQPQKQPHPQPETQIPEGYMLIKLPAGTLSEQEIKELAVDDVHEIVLRMKNDAEIFYARYAENMEKFKLKMEQFKADRAQPQEKTTEAKSKSPILSPTQPIFKDGLFHSYIDGLVERAKATKDFAQGIPSFDILSEMLDAQYSTLSKKYGETECEQTIEYSEAVNIGSDKEDEDVNIDSVITRVVDSLNQDQVVAAAPVPRVISNYLLHSNIVPSGVHLVAEELGCTIDCGQPDVGMPLVSDLLKSNKILFDPVLKLRKQVMDYCFFTNAKLVKPDRLASYGLVHFLGVDEIETLLPDVKIDSSVIECWAILLNKMTSLRKDAPKPRRLFFGLNHSAPLEKYMHLMNEAEVDEKEKKLNKLIEEIDSSWKVWLGLCNKKIDEWFEKDNDEADAMPDLVFLPLFIDLHYFCVCINFIDNTVDYLDNRTYVDFEDTDYARLAKLAVVHFGKFLIGKNVEAGRMLLESKPMRIQNFNWTSPEGNLDCGVFMMFHMLFYDGKVFNSELHDENKRILYRAEIAATLVLSDYNECRPEMLETIAQFSEKKHQLSKNPKTPTSQKGKKAACLTVLGSPKTSKSDGLGSTLDFGEDTETVELISRFLRSNQPMFSKMKPLRKKVVDYCLLDDYDLPPSETVAFYNKDDFLERQDIMSLRPTVNVTGRVIECWAHLMNQIDHNEPGETSLMFFGIRHADTIYSIYQNELEGNQVFDSKYKSVCHVWDRFVAINNSPCNLKAQLVFVPMVYEDHYFCVCLNFKKGKVEVLDNTRSKDWESTTTYKMAQIIVKCMSSYLNEKGVPNVKELEAADVVNLPMEWQEEEPNNEESGCFLMIHMLRYEGELFAEELKRKVFRRYYWAEMAASLLLADINSWRDKLIEKVLEFEKKKEEVWVQLKEERLVKPKKGTSKRKEINTEEPILRTAAKKQKKGKK